ncbi:MAG: hypothetical protein GAK35_03416 [Herbaspirillum frisingense]|uniref:Uncharacterized protein n=1 Tax=Herbaspirillum frisingense TaxID=92645 RepID=A0A7V8FUK9_9BURK|nr:MAG: hypothetical protein GAK35_03416 [Herbaspirillum frisingense]
MKHSLKSGEKLHGGKFMPRVAKLDKNKYAAYVDTQVNHLWDMALQGQAVRICKKRKRAEKAALALLAEAMRQDGGAH